jgi:hypothetical protein
MPARNGRQRLVQFRTSQRWTELERVSVVLPGFFGIVLLGDVLQRVGGYAYQSAANLTVTGVIGAVLLAFAIIRGTQLYRKYKAVSRASEGDS